MVLFYEDLKTEYRLTNDDDAWGNCMGWLFAVCGEIYMRGRDIPAAWGYSPGMASDPRDPESYEGQSCKLATDQALDKFGENLHRLAGFLKACGKDY